MKYIDYHNANDFYTIDEACDELNLSKKELQRYSETPSQTLWKPPTRCRIEAG